MSFDEFSASTIEAEYQRLRYRLGWTFMATPESTLRKAKVAIVGLNPGGGGKNDDCQYGGLWDAPEGNAYFTEKWGVNGTETQIQSQVRAWHSLLEAKPEDTLCAQFVPFRSPDWASLERKAEAVAFSERLWRWVFDVSPASLFITMGKLPSVYLAEILKARRIATLPTGWGNQMIDVYDSPAGRRVVAMPHPSRYALFNRSSGGSAIAEESFRVATGKAS